jgi:hypothetical protein
VRQLHVVALSEDGRSVLLATSKTATAGAFSVPLDGKLKAAVRGDLPRPGEQQAPGIGVTPKEIQARLRAGESTEQIAAAAGVPVARVERYAGPVLSERERIIEDVRAGFVSRSRRGPSQLPLGDAVDAALAETSGLRADSVTWTARRLESGHWLVQVSYVARARTRTASWVFEPHTRSVTASDSASAALGHVGDEPAPRRVLAPARPAATGRATARPAKRVVKKAAKKAAKKAVAKAAPKPRAAAKPAAKNVARTRPQPATFAPRKTAAKKPAAPKPVAAKAKPAAPKPVAAKPRPAPVKAKSVAAKAKPAAAKATKPTRVATKPPAKTATKPAAKTATKPAAKTATKPAAKTATKPAARTATKPAKKAAAKAAAPTRVRTSGRRVLRTSAAAEAAAATATPPREVRKSSKDVKRVLRPSAAAEAAAATATPPSEGRKSGKRVLRHSAAAEALASTPVVHWGPPVEPATPPTLRVVPQPVVEPTAEPAPEPAKPATPTPAPAGEVEAAPVRKRRAAGERAHVPDWADVLLGTAPKRSDD